MSFFDFFKRRGKLPTNSSPPSPPLTTPVEPAVKLPELSDGEIMLLEYCTYGSYPNPKRGYPMLWTRKFHISDVDQALRSLESRGYIEFNSALETIPKFTIAQLKDVAEKNGVVVRGKKAEILSTIQALPVEDLERTVGDRKYHLTEKGRLTLQDNQHIVFAYQNPWTGISVDELKELSAKETDIPARDLIWAELNRRCCYLPASGCWDEYRQVRYAMFQFLKQEQRHNSLGSHIFLSDVFFLDINDSVPLIAPGVVSDIQGLVVGSEYSRDDIFNYVRNHLCSCALPCRYFSKLDVAGIYTGLAFGLYSDICEVLALCPGSPAATSAQMRVRNLDTGDWELVPAMANADYLIHQVLYIQKFMNKV